MKIAICVKQVPDSWAEKKMVNGRLDRESVEAVLNDLDEYAIEEALRIAYCAMDHQLLVENDGPGDHREIDQNQQDQFDHRPGIEHQFQEFSP